MKKTRRKSIKGKEKEKRKGKGKRKTINIKTSKRSYRRSNRRRSNRRRNNRRRNKNKASKNSFKSSNKSKRYKQYNKKRVYKRNSIIKGGNPQPQPQPQPSPPPPPPNKRYTITNIENIQDHIKFLAALIRFTGVELNAEEDSIMEEISNKADINYSEELKDSPDKIYLELDKLKELQGSAQAIYDRLNLQIALPEPEPIPLPEPEPEPELQNEQLLTNDQIENMRNILETLKNDDTLLQVWTQAVLHYDLLKTENIPIDGLIKTLLDGVRLMYIHWDKKKKLELMKIIIKECDSLSQNMKYSNVGLFEELKEQAKDILNGE